MNYESHMEIQRLRRRIEYLVNDNWQHCPKDLRQQYSIPQFNPDNYKDIAELPYQTDSNEDQTSNGG